MAQATLTENVSSDNAVCAAPVPAPFDFKGHQIRTVIQNDQPWFVARDVAAALQIGWSGHTLDSVPALWRGMVKLTTPVSRTGGGGLQKVAIISEPAVYKLAFRSNKPEAEEFTNWVASEVLPAIRKTGQYQAQPEPQPIPAGLSTTEDRKPLRSLINAWSVVANLPHAALYAQVRANFNLSRIDELPAAWIPDALAFVQARIDAGQPKALPKPEPEALPAPAPGNPLPLRQILDDLGKMMSMARKIDAAIYNRTLQIGTFAADRSPAQAEADRHMHGMPGQMLQSGVKMIEEGVSFLHRAAEGAEAMVALSRREVR